MPRKKRYPRPKRFSNKPKYDSRGHRSPIYIKWREDVKKRDGKRCQWPNCGCRNKNSLEVHHIKTWAKYPALRFVLANGITLCKRHHAFVKGKEVDYEVFFLKLLECQMIRKLKKNRKK